MDDLKEEKSITITGQLDVSDELCSDGTIALSVTLDNGDEYIINNRYTAKRLSKLAYLQETLTFTGTTRLDSTGLQILSVQACSRPEAPEPPPKTRKTRKNGKAAASSKK